MRWIVVLGLAAVAFAQDRGHDELGFPITFNDEVITRNDVLRNLGLTELEPGPWRAERTAILMQKLTQRLGQIYGLEIDDANVDAYLQRKIDLRGGEAPFYEYLGQRGQTLERYRESLRLELLDYQIKFMLSRGYTQDRRFLPWNLRPTPREIQIAFENDPERLGAGTRVRYEEFRLDVDRKVREKLSGQVMLGKLKAAEMEEQIRELIRPKVEAVQEALERGEGFASVAAAQGLKVKEDARRLAKEPANETERFLKDAKAGDTSPPIPQDGGLVLFVHLVEVDRPEDASLESAEVLREYTTRIHELRKRKAEARLRLQALDSSTVRPDRVRDELRDLLLASFKDAEAALRDLGLH